MGGSDWIGYCGTFIGYLIKFKTIFPISLGQIKSKSGRYTYTYEDRNFCEIESKDNIKISEAWKAYLEKHDLSEAFEDYEELEFSKAYPAWTGGCDSSPAEAYYGIQVGNAEFERKTPCSQYMVHIPR